MFDFLKKTSYTFEGKKEREDVILFLHQHWFVLVNKVTVAMILGLLPFLLLVIFGQFILAHNLIPMFTFIWAGELMALWFYLFYTLTMYTLDYWIVTNERVVDNTQRGFFNRQISELSIHMIQDVSVKLVGFMPTFLNYGSVEIQTAAIDKHFLLERVPNPQSVKDKVMEIIEKTEDELGPRMHGMTQRHHFHPDKYVISRISSETKDAFSKDADIGTNPTATNNQNPETFPPENLPV